MFGWHALELFREAWEGEAYEVSSTRISNGYAGNKHVINAYVKLMYLSTKIYSLLTRKLVYIV